MCLCVCIAWKGHPQNSLFNGVLKLCSLTIQLLKINVVCKLVSYNLELWRLLLLLCFDLLYKFCRSNSQQLIV